MGIDIGIQAILEVSTTRGVDLKEGDIVVFNADGSPLSKDTWNNVDMAQVFRTQLMYFHDDGETLELIDIDPNKEYAVLTKQSIERLLRAANAHTN